MGADQEENAIVTSTGEYVVAWDFNKVKKGYLDKYHIKKCVSLHFPFRPHVRFCSLSGAFTGTRIRWCKTTSSLGMTRRS